MQWLDRQSFLGADSATRIGGVRVGQIGLGGGGSGISQHLAFHGFRNIVMADPDRVEETNRNRLVGLTRMDVWLKRRKTAIACRTVRRINPSARVECHAVPWQEAVDAFRSCDVILSAVDSFRARHEIETFCRRYFIPLIDIGMTVTESPAGYQVSGQVFLSTPGEPCLHCVNILNEKRLRQEADRYGAAGPAAQTAWANGVLAASAVGMLIEQISPWSNERTPTRLLEYDGNHHVLRPSAKLQVLEGRTCPHHPLIEAGDPAFDRRKL